jgi:tetratricopeptide (TPR) repeat protein
MAPLSPLFPLFLLPLERQADMRKLSQLVPLETRQDFNRRDFARAIETLDAWPARDSNRKIFVKAKALCLLESRDLERTREFILAEAPHFSFYTQLQTRLRQLTKELRAEAEAPPAGTVPPEFVEQEEGPDERELSVEALFAEKRYVEAEVEARQLVAERTHSSGYRHLLAESLAHQRKYLEALGEAWMAVRLDDSARNWFLLALIYSKFGTPARNKQACLALCRAIQGKPRPRYFSFLARLLYHLEDYPRAEQATNRALALTDANRDLNLNLLVRIYLARGRLELALPLARSNFSNYGQERDRFWLARCERAAKVKEKFGVKKF